MMRTIFHKKSLSQYKQAVNSEAHALLLQLLKEKDNEIGNLREEIGRLKAENAEIKRHAERLAGLANTDSTAHVG